MTGPAIDHAAFIRANTELTAPPLVPELRLHLATEVTPLWHATEATLQRTNVPPPYWAFAWPGGRAMARLLLDRPELVAGRRVFDFAAGSAVGALAALRAGAAGAMAVDIDPFAIAAARLNAEANGLSGLELDDGDWIGDPLDGYDLIMAGDVCYERPLAERVAAWLKGLAASGRFVMLADPGRAYLPAEGLERVAAYTVPTSLDLEDRSSRETIVYRVRG
ncbi:MAG TPA: 50S ribosomal protein L11 methyltransferase [Alphaproteobacteria bacterium]|nr:50S ribosomal protein L11 methyltransferase [Alphaproteobacteria bacterium]